MPINRMPTMQFINVKQRNRLDSLVTDVTPNAPPEVVAKVREIVLAEVEKHPEEFDTNDIARFMQSDWTITRFLMRKRDNIEDAAQMLIGCAKWRHKLGMPRWKDEDFPREFYELGGVFPYASDELGNTVIYIRGKLYDRKLTCIQELFRHYLIHIANRVDMERDGRGWSMIFDCSGTGMANMDVNMVLFMLNEIIPNLPKGLNYVLIYELPWLLSKIVNTAIACLPLDYKKLAKTASKKDIHNWVSKENMPDFMGGTCEINYRRAPPNCRTLREMQSDLGLTDKDLDQIEKTFQPFLDEANEAIAKRKKNIRRRSSVLEFWHWMKGDRKSSVSSASAGSPDPNDPSGTDENNTSAGATEVKKKTSVTSKARKSLAIIKDTDE